MYCDCDERSETVRELSRMTGVDPDTIERAVRTFRATIARAVLDAAGAHDVPVSPGDS